MAGEQVKWHLQGDSQTNPERGSFYDVVSDLHKLITNWPGLVGKLVAWKIWNFLLCGISPPP